MDSNDDVSESDYQSENDSGGEYDDPSVVEEIKEVSMSGKHKLALRGAGFYKTLIGLSRGKYAKSKALYDSFGQYGYSGASHFDGLYQKVGHDFDGRYRVYIGQYQYGTQISEGVGIEVWKSGSIYEGHFLNDRRHGQGRYIFPGGKAYYIGGFKNGRRHGKGSMKYPNGKKRAGTWKNGKFAG